MTPAVPSRAELAECFRTQARGCALTGSTIYAELLARAADDLARGGLFADLVSTYRGVPILDALPLRILGAVHAMVLGGRAPALAAFYPSAGGHFEAEGAFRAICELCDAHRDALRDAAATLRVQTNEVRRSAVLVPGLLRVAARTGLPLRICEIGSSAGLNLLFDRYRYELGPHRWGDAASPLVLATSWDGAPPDLEAPLRVARRRGCDLAPFDVRDPAHRLRLESFVWPEQLDRLARLRAAIAIAMREPPMIDTEPGGAWVEAQLAGRAEGVATVLFHSVVWWYIPEAERARITRAMEAAGASATRTAPLAWLRMEGATLEEAELRLRLWPDGEDALLARVHWHGAEIRWLV
ncbi:MAG: DUF2332 domain-containing protein [Proteobacteria bacterium]|nr:DUF2332 domain-containing protein [Pseudomonadota bacterium]